MASILLIEDDENLRNMTAELLRSAGHTVDTADDGKPGIALYKAKLHDLIITDIVMPDMDGLKLIDELRQTASRPRIIAMSGDSKLSVPLYLPIAKLLGADRILAKPVLPDVLLKTVADALAKPAPATITRALPDKSNKEA
jgi:two-component system chemotaxis response regulator CheY